MSIEHPDENLDTGNLDTGNLDTGNQPAGTDRIEDDRRRLRRLSTLLDSQFRIPGTQIRFGVDPIIGVIPGLGDSAGLVASGVVLAQAIQLGGPAGATLARMILNVVLDGVVGTVPLLGTVFDVVYKANNRNVALLERHVTDPAATASASGRALVLTAVVIIVILFVAVALVVAAIVALLSWLF